MYPDMYVAEKKYTRLYSVYFIEGNHLVIRKHNDLEVKVPLREAITSAYDFVTMRDMTGYTYAITPLVMKLCEKDKLQFL